MEEVSILRATETGYSQRDRSNIYKTMLAPSVSLENRALRSLITEGGESFFNYVSWLGFDNDPNLLVLSSRHHYYYDVDELKGITTLINIKKLNLMRHLDSFLHVVCNMLSPDTTFVGCFSDRKKRREDKIHSRIYKRFINFLDDRTDRDIDKNYITKLFESYGFKIVDMTEINGLTYFTTKKYRRPVNYEA